MAHPKHRTSKQRRNKRRTHDAITVTAIAKCVLTVVLLYSIIQYVLNVDITEESWLLRKQ